MESYFSGYFFCIGANSNSCHIICVRNISHERAVRGLQGGKGAGSLQERPVEEP